MKQLTIDDIAAFSPFNRGTIGHNWFVMTAWAACFSKDGELRPPSKQRRALHRAAKLYGTPVDGEKLDNASILISAALSNLASAQPQNKAGRPIGSGATANALMRTAIPWFRAELELAQERYETRTGRKSRDFAGELEARGLDGEASPDGERAKPTGLNTLAGILTVLAEQNNLGEELNMSEFRKAAENIRRSNRRKR